MSLIALSCAPLSPKHTALHPELLQFVPGSYEEQRKEHHGPTKLGGLEQVWYLQEMGSTIHIQGEEGGE